MEKKYSSEEQANLRTVEHLDMQNQPQLLQQMLSLATTPEEQDILLMAALTATSRNSFLPSVPSTNAESSSSNYPRSLRRSSC